MIPKWLGAVTVAGLVLCYIGILFSVYRIFALLADEVMTSQGADMLVRPLIG